jgi:hypothetical protein
MAPALTIEMSGAPCGNKAASAPDVTDSAEEPPAEAPAAAAAAAATAPADGETTSARENSLIRAAELVP